MSFNKGRGKWINFNFTSSTKNISDTYALMEDIKNQSVEIGKCRTFHLLRSTTLLVFANFLSFFTPNLVRFFVLCKPDSEATYMCVQLAEMRIYVIHYLVLQLEEELKNRPAINIGIFRSP